MTTGLSMFQLPFYTVKKINSKPKNIISGYINEAQLLWKSVNPYYRIPKSIQYTILLFYYDTIKSSILTDIECNHLVELFEQHDKFNDLGSFSYNLIYKCSIDGWDEKKFKSEVHNKSNILCLIHTLNNNVFGGYTSTGWRKGRKKSNDNDDKAFIFNIRSCCGYPSGIYNAKKGHESLRVQPGYICMFGDDCTMWIYCDEQEGAVTDTSKDYQNRPKEYKNCFTDNPFNHFHAVDVEVFQLV